MTYTDGSTEYTEPICDSSWEVANEVKAELQEEFTSKFEQFSNEITLEITGSLGSTASIVMTAGGVEHKDELELSAIRQAFANDDTAVEISAGLITFNSGTIVINSNNFTLDSTGKITATGAQINGNITTVDGNYKTHFDNGSVELYFKDGFCGSINTKDRYDVNRGGIVLTVENDGRYIEFNTFQNNTFRTHYVMNAGYFEGDEAQNKFVHHFYSTAKFYHTVHFVGEGAFCSSLCMQNNAFIKSYNHSTGKIGEEMLGYDGTYVNVGSTGGLTMLRGKTVYLKDTSTTVTSDRNAKNSIESLPDAYEAFFDNLEPVRFKYNEGVSGRYHVGYIAQDVETALGKAGLSSMDFAGFVDVGFSGELGLTYDEFIAVLHKKIKRLESRIAELENRKESESS